MRSLLIYILLALTLAACGNGESMHPTLLHADSLLPDDPDSALVVLNSADSKSFSTADSAYYNLLLTHALVWQNADIASDSIIAAVQNYYSKYNPNSDRAIRASYLLANIQYKNNKYTHAVGNALAVYEWGRLNNPYWGAKGASLLGDIYLNSYNYQTAADFYQTAADLYKKAGRTRLSNYALGDKGIALLNTEKALETCQTMDSIYQKAFQEKDTLLAEYVVHPIISELIFHNQYQIACTKYPQYALNIDSCANQEDASLQSKIDAAAVSNGPAYRRIYYKMFADASSIQDSVLIMYALHQKHLSNNNYKEAAKLGDSLLDIQSALAHDIINQSTELAKSNFYSHRAKQYESQNRQLTSNIVWAGILTLVLISAVITAYVIHIKIKQKNVELKVAIIKDLITSSQLVQAQNTQLTAAISDYEATILNLKANLSETERTPHETAEPAPVSNQLYRDKWETLNDLCYEFYELSESPKQRQYIWNKISELISSFSSPAKQLEIEEGVNQYMDNFIKKLRTECLFLDELEIAIVTYAMAGFSQRAICLFCNITYTKYYYHKKRILDKIKQSNVPSKDMFIQEITAIRHPKKKK